MNKKISGLVAMGVASAALLGASPAALAAVYTNASGVSPGVLQATFGQGLGVAFVLSEDSVLTNWTYFGNGTSGESTFAIAAFDGQMSFANLFSTSLTANAAGNWVYSTAGLALSAGSYIAYLSPLDANGQTDIAFTALAGDLPGGGVALRRLDEASPWDNMGTNLKYSVDITAAAVPAVPEPETYAMLLAGLGLMATVARRQRQAARLRSHRAPAVVAV